MSRYHNAARAAQPSTNALETVVESRRYGAPTSVSPASDGSPTDAALTTSLSESFLSVCALGTSSDARLVGVLLVVVLLTTLAAVVLAIRRGPN